MTPEEFESFKSDPDKWFHEQLIKAVEHDPLLYKCYYTHLSITESYDNPFDKVNFLRFALYQALMSNEINYKQLEEMMMRTMNPVRIISDN